MTLNSASSHESGYFTLYPPPIGTNDYQLQEFINEPTENLNTDMNQSRVIEPTLPPGVIDYGYNPYENVSYVTPGVFYTQSQLHQIAGSRVKKPSHPPKGQSQRYKVFSKVQQYVGRVMDAGTVFEPNADEQVFVDQFREIWEKIERARSLKARQHSIERQKNAQAIMTRPISSIGRTTRTLVREPYPKTPERPKPRSVEDDSERRRHVDRYIKRAQNKECKPDGRRGHNEGRLSCTRVGCEYRVSRQSDWERHEQIRQPQDFFVCDVCLDQSKPKPFITHRSDKIGPHIKKTHPEHGDALDALISRSKVEYDAPFENYCRFCNTSYQFNTWNERCEHMLNHFNSNEEGPDLFDGDDDGSPDGGGDTDYSGSGYTRPPPDWGNGDDGRGGGSFGPDGSGQHGFNFGHEGYGLQYHRPNQMALWNANRLASPIVMNHRFMSTGLLGRGSHGTVYKVVQGATGVEFAQKIIDLAKNGAARRCSFLREIRIMKKLDHPHVTRFVDAWLHNQHSNMIMSPVAESNLREYLDDPGKWPQYYQHLREWILCLASTVSYIHSQRIRHADLKPQNILIHHSEICIGDFGISRDWSDTESTSESISPLTPMYAAPELVHRKPHGRSADIFSLGCIYLELATLLRHKSVQQFHGFLNRSEQKQPMQLNYHDRIPQMRKWISLLQHHSPFADAKLLDICRAMIHPARERRPKANWIVKRLKDVSFVAQDRFTLPKRNEHLDGPISLPDRFRREDPTIHGDWSLECPPPPYSSSRSSDSSLAGAIKLVVNAEVQRSKVDGQLRVQGVSNLGPIIVITDQSKVIVADISWIWREYELGNQGCNEFLQHAPVTVEMDIPSTSQAQKRTVRRLIRRAGSA